MLAEPDVDMAMESYKPGGLNIELDVGGCNDGQITGRIDFALEGPLYPRLRRSCASRWISRSSTKGGFTAVNAL